MIKLSNDENGIKFDTLLTVDVVIPEDIFEKVLQVFFRVYLLRKDVILVRDVVHICAKKTSREEKTIALELSVYIQKDLLEKQVNRYFAVAHPGRIMLPLEDKLVVLDEDAKSPTFWLLVKLYLNKQTKGTER